jgi:hypothetical protein
MSESLLRANGGDSTRRQVTGHATAAGGTSEGHAGPFTPTGAPSLPRAAWRAALDLTPEKRSSIGVRYR